MSEGTERMYLQGRSFVSTFLTSNTCAMSYYIACSAVTATKLQLHCFSYNASAFGSALGNFFTGACTLCLVRIGIEECIFVCMAKERVCFLQGSVELQCNVYMSVVGASAHRI